MVKFRRQPRSCTGGSYVCCDPVECEPVSCYRLNSVGTVVPDTVDWSEIIYELVNFPSTGVLWYNNSINWSRFTITSFDQINGTYTVTRSISTCNSSMLTVDYEVGVTEEVFPLDGGGSCPDLDAVPTINTYLTATLRLQFFPAWTAPTPGVDHNVFVSLPGIIVGGGLSGVTAVFGFIEEQYLSFGIPDYTDDNTCETSRISLRNIYPANPFGCTELNAFHDIYGDGSTAETVV